MQITLTVLNIISCTTFPYGIRKFNTLQCYFYPLPKNYPSNECNSRQTYQTTLRTDYILQVVIKIYNTRIPSRGSVINLEYTS